MLYCSKYRDTLSHRIAAHKASPSDYQQIKVLAKKNGKFECVCRRCKHTWHSKSKEAEASFNNKK